MIYEPDPFMPLTPRNDLERAGAEWVARAAVMSGVRLTPAEHLEVFLKCLEHVEWTVARELLAIAHSRAEEAARAPWQSFYDEQAA